MWKSLKNVVLRFLEPSTNVYSLEKRILAVEQKVEALQTKVETMDTNVALILGHPALTELEVEMTRLEKIFSSGADRFFPMSWYWLQRCPNECLLLAKG